MNAPAHTANARLDAAIAGALLLAATIFVARLPHNLGGSDESYFLYEAKRILDGEVLYRDVFLFVTPLSSYLMAGLFWLFGTTIATARVATALLHGGLVAATYGCARALGVQRGLAVTAGVAHLALAQTAWPYASMHWFSSACAGAALLLLLRSGATTARRATWIGIVCGLLIGVQQQRGVGPTAAIGAFLILEVLLERRYGGPTSARRLVSLLGAFAAGVALIIVPMLAIMVAIAGAEPVYHALVRFPLENYRFSAPQIGWGMVTPLTKVFADDTFPRVLRWLPLALVLPGLRMLVNLIRGRQPSVTRSLGALVLFVAGSIQSIWYNNDFIHIAFVALPLLVAAAASAQALLDAIPAPPLVQHASAWFIAIVTVTAMAQHLNTYMARKWVQFPYAHDSAFGRVDYGTKWEPVLMQATREALRSSGSTEMFCYPNLASPYLLTGGKNPTPFQQFAAHVFPARDIQRALDTLRDRRVPFLVISYAYLRRDDPIGQLLKTDYEAVPIPALPLTGEFPTTLLYRRKASADQDHP